MPDSNSSENLLRFSQLRPPRPVDQDAVIRLLATEFTRQLADLATATERVEVADQHAGNAFADFKRILEGDTAWRLADALDRTVEADGTIGDYRRAVAMRPEHDDVPEDGDAPVQDDVMWRDLSVLSDVLVVVKFSRRLPAQFRRRVEDQFRAYAAVVVDVRHATLELKLDRFMRLPLVLPQDFYLAAPALAQRHNPVTQPAAGEALVETLEELLALDRPELLTSPRSRRRRPFSLSAQGVKRLSAPTSAVLKKLGIDPATQPLSDVITTLEFHVAAAAPVPLGGTAPTPQGGSMPLAVGSLRPVGVADLLVVKQHLTGYERTDIAHVENVLEGEKKSRTHRALERTEETFITEREATHERETELETADRFELNREASRTVKRDQQFGFGLTLSGKYGPTIEFTSNAEMQVSSATEDIARTATTYARDVVERSLERVVERVREEQLRRVVREREETNLHELANTTGTGGPVIGVYQFLEKVYESQVFNYGVREMFDLMVPEPASYLWQLESAPDSGLNLPAPPPALDGNVRNADAVNAFNYLRLAALFGAEGVEPPPPAYKSAVVSLGHGEGGTESGQPRSVSEKELTVPEGYRPYRAVVRTLALTDQRLTLGINVGRAQHVWRPRTPTSLIDVGSGHEMGFAELELDLLPDSYVSEPQTKLPVHVLAFETNNYALTALLIFARTHAAYRAWQIKTYEALVDAFRTSMATYEQTVEELKARAEAEAARRVGQFGAPPSENLRTIRAELKKHCISIITKQRYDGFDATQNGFFDFDKALDQGSFIRFFEQAFEWDQMQYVLYPYFWARPTAWDKRLVREDVDPAFLEFLQAGEARVVVPVRPGFELAVTHYLETGEIWNGEGAPPPINSPLYVGIVTEIQERTGAPQGEVPVGDAWETRVPTPLAILRRETDLPKWQRQAPTEWDWQEVTGT